jgi:hypothetical protein
LASCPARAVSPHALDDLGKVDRRPGCCSELDPIPSRVENSAATVAPVDERLDVRIGDRRACAWALSQPGFGRVLVEMDDEVTDRLRVRADSVEASPGPLKLRVAGTAADAALEGHVPRVGVRAGRTEQR